LAGRIGGNHLRGRIRGSTFRLTLAACLRTALEELNRRLCHRLGGDPACCEYGRIMRLPGTLNQKRGARCRIVRADESRPQVDPEAIRATFTDPAPSPREGSSGTQGSGAPGPTTSWG
jgi:hypothetical protein